MPEYTTLKGVTHIGDSTACEQVKANVVGFFNWGILGIGGFSNYERSTEAAYGNFPAKLRAVRNPNFTNGQVWEGARADWVWESGVEYDYQPIQISGVYVNGTFYPSNTSGAFAHNINYPHGQVVFDTAIAPTSVVEVNHSSRYVSFHTSDAPWFKEIQFNSYRVDDSHFTQGGSGAWSVLAQNRIQLPAVVVETVPRREMIPMQLGGGQWIRQDILFHIYAENTWDRDKLLDIITYQKEKTILGFDKNAMSEANRFPLEYDGSLASGAMIYPDLVKSSGEGGFFWKKIFFKEMRSQESTSVPPLYTAIVRGTFEVDFPEI